MTNSLKKRISLALIATAFSFQSNAQIISDLGQGSFLPENKNTIVTTTDTMGVYNSAQMNDWNFTLESFSDVKTITERQLQEKIAAAQTKTNKKDISHTKDENGIELYLLTDSGIKEQMQLLFPGKEITVTHDLIKWIRFYGYNKRKYTERIFKRYSGWEEHIRTVFASRGVPQEIAELCLIESGCTYEAVSKAGAVGMWQIMPSTGISHGMTVSAVRDDRRDPIRSTDVASRILSSSHKLVPNWLLNIAGYNCGMGKIQNAVRKTGSTDWLKIKPLLPKETQQYIPSFIAIHYVWTYRKQLGFKI